MIKRGNYITLQKGDIVFADASEDYKGIAEPSVILEDLPYNVVAGLHTIAIRLKHNDPLFMYYLFTQKNFRKHGYRVGTGMKVFGISESNLLKFSYFYPEYEEQLLIKKLLNFLDNLITLYQRKTDLLEQVKKNGMRDLLPEKYSLVPTVRFGEFRDTWIKNNLGNISDIRTGSSDLQDSVNDGKYPFFVRSENIETSNRYLFNGEAILIPGEGRLGDIYHYINGKFDYHQRVYKISNFNDFNNFGLFIFYCMQKNFKRHALKYTVKATVESLRLPSLLGFQIKLPSIEEQIKISKYFKTIDNSIVLYESKLERLMHLKNFYQNKLFI